MYKIDPIDILNIKLKWFKKYFKGWGSNLYGTTKKRNAALKEELASIEKVEETSCLSPELYTTKVDIQVELNDIYADEELAWAQKSHERWILEGDQNTAYFHRVANGRRRKNTIFSWKHGDDVIEDTDNILQHATEFYKNLSGPTPGNTFSISSSMWPTEEILNDEDDQSLTRPFTLEEIKHSLFSMEPTRASGPDNIPIEFFQACWEIVKMDMLHIFNSFYDGTLDVKRMNYGVITLLPKISGADRIQQYRPICLLKCGYKWITKTINLRLDPFADKLFSVESECLY